MSEQIGVSPWYDWADVPVTGHDDLSVCRGAYTEGEPAVKYRGIFLNDEAPCLTGWVKHTYGTDYGDHRFYERVFELILRLRGNFIWPAMWSWAFYADDPENIRIADEMGVIVGTSHHEPMARNHQEWARNRSAYGEWNYSSNRQVTGRPAHETPQVWALYKEVQDYYDKGLRVPDDVTILLSDDNWGDVRRLPDASERERTGGWGMYYHVDYVGAPRNSKWLMSLLCRICGNRCNSLISMVSTVCGC